MVADTRGRIHFVRVTNRDLRFRLNNINSEVVALSNERLTKCLIKSRTVTDRQRYLTKRLNSKVSKLCPRCSQNVTVKFTFPNRTSFSKGAGIAQWYSAGLRTGWSGVRVPVGAGNFSPHHRVQTGSGAYPASYIMGTRGSFLGSKAAGAWSWPFISI
jgi:hypothetical protein